MTTPDFSDDALRTLTDGQLLENLNATDQQLQDLHNEIRRRMRARADVEHRREQHAQISRMVQHLDDPVVDWQAVRDFFRDVFVDFPDSPDSDEPRGAHSEA